MPFQVQNDYNPSRERMLLLLFSIVLGLGLSFGMSFNEDSHWLIWYIIFSQVFVPPTVCLHELGHAWMAQLSGGEVHYIRLGQDKGKTTPRRVSFLKFDWLIYSYPQTGAVVSSFYTTHRYRLRRCLMIVGGPLMNLVLFFAALPFIHWKHVTVPHIFGVSWLLTNSILFFGSVVPFVLRYQGTDHPNDGMLFWRTLAFSDKQIEDYVATAERSRGFVVDYAFASTMPIADLLALQTKNSSNPVFLHHAVLKLHAANDPQFVEHALQLINHPVLLKNARLDTIDLYLTWLLHYGPASNPEVADRLSHELIQDNDQITTHGTRGSILVDIGRIEEGKAMLEDVLRKTTSAIDETYANVFLALAEKKQGNLPKARAYAQKAAKIDPASQVLKRVSDLLET